MSSLPMKDKGCLLSSKKKKAVPKLGHPVQNSQMVPVFLEGGGCFLNFHIFIYLFLSKFCLEKKGGEGGIKWCAREARKEKKTVES